MGVRKLEDDFYVLGIVIEVRFSQVCLRDVYIQLYLLVYDLDRCVCVLVLEGGFGFSG